MPKENSSEKSKSLKARKPPDHIEVYYDVRDSSYWYRLNGRYVQLGASDFRMHMRSEGLREDESHNGNREIDWPMWNAQINRQIDYAGSLAGHRVGIFSDGSKRQFLITDEPNGVWDDAPKKAALPKFFMEFIQEMLPGDQWSHFCQWLAISLRSLRRCDFQPGQVAVLAGPAQCGKSLLQYIITQVFGGRSANPFEYMIGGKFNYDLAGAEHWQIEDPNSTTDLRTRRSFGNKLKECSNNEDFNIHKKNKDALKLPMFRRITISVNDEPENLAVIPPLDDSIADKISLYKCERVSEALKRFILTTPALNGFGDIIPIGQQDRSGIKRTVKEETPLIRAWLLRTFQEVPEGWADQRCGIRSYHHPDLLEQLSSLAPEVRLLQLIDATIFAPDPKGDALEMRAWTGRNLDLEERLRKSAFGFECDKLLRGNQCITYLKRLKKSHPTRVSNAYGDGGYRHWVIQPPPMEKENTHGVQDDTAATN